jgi:SpoIID/LytB domain protein
MRWRRGAVALSVALFVGVPHAQAPQGLPAEASARRPAFFVRGVDNPRERREARPEILDTPMFPGSIVKAVSLVAALESGVVRAETGHMCRRVSTVDGRRFVCAHPDLKRALSPAEALAYSCNDFFVSLAPRLSRDVFNRTRAAAGLPPIASATPLAPAMVGLDGPKTTPRALVDVMSRLVGAGLDKPVPMSAETRSVLLEGLRGAADYGTASALKARGVSAVAKTGTVTTPSGIALGLVVALTPADRPTRAIVVAAPGGAGVDAAAIAADVLSTPQASAPSLPRTIRLGRSQPNGRTRVETMSLDDYIAQVLAGEGQPKAADGAQQALAITARTFAMANRNRHRKEGYDLCDTTHCQVLRASTPITRRAAEATSGRILLHQGQPAFVFYSAWCGGRSELASHVWPGAIDYPYEPSLEDDACEDEPEWTSEIRAGDIERALRSAGLKGSTLRDLRILSRNRSERVDRLRVDGFTPREINGHEFRMAVGRVAGWQLLKSTAFDVERTSAGYRFRGRGFGHGVGLCVVGAGKRASQGATADDILRFYFPGLTVGPSRDRPLTAAPASPSPPAIPAVADVALALPAGEERERSAVLALIRRSRDEVAKATGALAPPRLRVTVHTNVESFGRATGQPWWVSGATDGPAIDLLPVTILRQQGQLERTIRHEVTHALLDGALAKRPMWVREGAAAYYANPNRPAGERPARVACPTDAELLRPVSAGSQREAYARAEACFARAIAEGRRWDQVR